MKLVIIRYPETNKVAHLSGEPEIPSPKGRQQLLQLAEICQQEKVKAVAHSILPRTTAASEVLAGSLDVPSILIEGLQERNFGDWAKWEWPQISSHLSKLPTEARYTFAPPHGESWQEMDVRLNAALRDIAALGLDSVAVMTHASCIRVLLVLIRGAPKESVLKLVPALGGSFIEDYNPPVV